MSAPAPVRRNLEKATSDHGYFEDFEVGQHYKHARGRTIDNVDNLWITHTTMNTSEAHFNLGFAQSLMDGLFPERLVMGAVTTAIIVGLTSEDMSENAFMDLGMTDIKLSHPVFEGDTLYAASEVLELRDDPARADAGILVYRFRGWKEPDVLVAEGIRTVSVKRRSHWVEENR